MKNVLFYFALILILAAATSSRAVAEPYRGCEATPQGQPPSCNKVAPEVDPGMVVGGLTLLGGALAVARGRRKQQFPY